MPKLIPPTACVLLLALLCHCAQRRKPEPTTDPVKAPEPVYWKEGGSGESRIVISLKEQRLALYRGGELVLLSPISSGREGHDTHAGKFKVIEKDRDHSSSCYGSFVDKDNMIKVEDVDVRRQKAPAGTRFMGAPMAWFVRFNGSIGLHQGDLPGYPASHGCIRLPGKMAYHVFESCKVGTTVEVKENAKLMSQLPLEVLAALNATPSPAAAPSRAKGWFGLLAAGHKPTPQAQPEEPKMPAEQASKTTAPTPSKAPELAVAEPPKRGKPEKEKPQEQKTPEPKAGAQPETKALAQVKSGGFWGRFKRSSSPEPSLPSGPSPEPEPQAQEQAAKTKNRSEESGETPTRLTDRQATPAKPAAAAAPLFADRRSPIPLQETGRVAGFFERLKRGSPSEPPPSEPAEPTAKPASAPAKPSTAPRSPIPMQETGRVAGFFGRLRRSSPSEPPPSEPAKLKPPTDKPTPNEQKKPSSRDKASAPLELAAAKPLSTSSVPSTAEPKPRTGGFFSSWLSKSSRDKPAVAKVKARGPNEPARGSPPQPTASPAAQEAPKARQANIVAAAPRLRPITPDLPGIPSAPRSYRSELPAGSAPSAASARGYAKGKATQREGIVKSPYPPYAEVDVSGLPSGSLAVDPVSNQVFEVPGGHLKARAGRSPGTVISPYKPYREVDVSGLRSGSLAIDPTTQRVFEVP